MAKSRTSLSRRPSNRSRTKRVNKLKKTLAAKQDEVAVKPLAANIQSNSDDFRITKESHCSQSSRSPVNKTPLQDAPLLDLEKIWESGNEEKLDLRQIGNTFPNRVDIGSTSTILNVESDSTFTNNLRTAWGTDEECEKIMAERLLVEVVPTETKIAGNRIVELQYLLDTTIRIAEKHARSCTCGHLEVVKETRSGLISTLTYQCNVCDKTFSCSTENPKKATLNTAAVWGTIAVGSTYKHTEELLSICNIPPLSSVMFYTLQEDLSKVWAESALRNMQTAGEEERRLVLENGHVDADGIPWICVYLDGGWSKRSYGHNYNASSGVAVIIGRQTKKVLYMGIRNKFCIICTRAANKNVTPSVHTCFTNWNGSSSGMEADIIVEGFSSSEEQHGLRYKQFIADRDSSVYLKIQEKVSYGKEVIKVECTNHVIKNYGKRLYAIKGDTKGVAVAGRKILTLKKLKNCKTLPKKQCMTMHMVTSAHLLKIYK